MPGTSFVGNVVVCKDWPSCLKSHLKMLSYLIVGNLVICNKIVNKASLRAMVFLNIYQKEVVGFCAGNMPGVTIRPKIIGPREIQGNFFGPEMVLGAWPRPCRKNYKPFQLRNNSSRQILGYRKNCGIKSAYIIWGFINTRMEASESCIGCRFVYIFKEVKSCG